MNSARAKPGWLQFHLRTILLVAIVACTTTAWLLERSRREREMERHQRVQKDLQTQLDSLEMRLQEIQSAAAAVNQQWQLRQIYRLNGRDPEASAESTAFVFSLPIDLRRQVAGLRHEQLRAEREISALREQLHEESIIVHRELRDGAAQPR